MGHVSYTIRPKRGLPGGTQIRNVAMITFDVNPPIATDQVDPHDPSRGTDPEKQALVTIDATPPAVAQVLAWGSAWSPAFLEFLQSSDLGAGGYAIPLVPGQPLVLPWSNVNRLSIRFSEDVVVGAGDFFLYGNGQAPLAAADFSYDPQTFTATWTLATPPTADRYRVSLPGTVRDRVGNVLGDGFTVAFNALPGDATRDGRVNALDLVQVRRKLTRTVADPGSGVTRYTPFDDINGDGRISVLDIGALRRRLYTQLPTAPAPLPVSPTANGRSDLDDPATGLLG